MTASMRDGVSAGVDASEVKMRKSVEAKIFGKNRAGNSEKQMAHATPGCSTLCLRVRATRATPVEMSRRV
jgi:hypothetical protein